MYNKKVTLGINLYGVGVYNRKKEITKWFELMMA